MFWVVLKKLFLLWTRMKLARHSRKRLRGELAELNAMRLCIQKELKIPTIFWCILAQRAWSASSQMPYPCRSMVSMVLNPI